MTQEEWQGQSLIISAHAVEQFRARIAAMSKAKARLFILAGIQHAQNRKTLPSGAVRIRTRRPFPFEFRAFCRFDEGRNAFVVATITRGDSCVRRKQKRRENAEGLD